MQQQRDHRRPGVLGGRFDLVALEGNRAEGLNGISPSSLSRGLASRPAHRVFGDLQSLGCGPLL